MGVALRHGRFWRPRVGGHLRRNCRFWFGFARAAAAVHGEAGGFAEGVGKLAELATGTISGTTRRKGRVKRFRPTP